MAGNTDSRLCLLAASENMNENGTCKEEERPPSPPSSRLLGNGQNLCQSIWNSEKKLLWLALCIPAAKFVYALIVIVLLSADDKVGFELAHPKEDGSLQKGEILLIQALFGIPMAVVTCILGCVIFCNYPTVSKTTINEYLLFYLVMFFLQMLSLVITMCKLEMDVWETIASIALAVGEGYSIFLIRWFMKGHVAKMKAQSMEMTTMKTNGDKQMNMPIVVQNI